MPGLPDSPRARIAISAVILSAVAASVAVVALNDSPRTEMAASAAAQNLSLVKPVPVRNATATPSATATKTGPVVTTRKITKTIVLPHDRVTRKNPGMAQGSSKVATEGRDGLLKVVYRMTLHDGKVVKRVKSSQEIVREPIDRVVEIGSKAPKPAPSSSNASSDSSSKGSTSSKGSSGSNESSSTGTKADNLNWPALANCESSGNPRAVNPAGYYGLYQFNLATWRSVGGSGNPIDASPAEQTKRAKILYNQRGSSPWPHCGARLYS